MAMISGEKTVMIFTSLLVLGMIVLGILYETPSRESMGGVEANATTPATAGTDPRLKLIPPGLIAEQLPEADSPGAKALALYCTQCHELPVPGMHEARQWDAVLGRMKQYMNQRQGGMLVRLVRPSDKSWNELTDYLKRHALKAMADGSADVAEAAEFKRFCVQCHALPDPGELAAEQWPRVVVRMKSHMQNNDKAVPSDTETDRINAFLADRAAGKATP